MLFWKTLRIFAVSKCQNFTSPRYSIKLQTDVALLLLERAH